MLYLDFSDHRPLYEQIKDGFKELIVSGALAQEAQIPSVRELAQSLAINPNTIQRAYKELETEGYIRSVRGKGNFVAPILSEIRAGRMAELLPEFHRLTGALKAVGAEEEALVKEIHGVYTGEGSSND